MTVRTDLLGVTSTIRALGLRQKYYDRILDSFPRRTLLSFMALPPRRPGLDRCARLLAVVGVIRA